MRTCYRLFASMLVLLVLGGCAHTDDNFRPVEEGVLHRSAQMRAGRLGKAIRDHGFVTVVNLRGESDESWYREERAVCAAFGTEHVDFDWSMRRIPDPESLNAYVDLIENAEGPVLVHCQGGIHRAGTASAIYVLMQGGTPEEARKQFGFYFHNAPIGQLVTLFEERGNEKTFAEWVRSDYPATYAAWIQNQEHAQ